MKNYKYVFILILLLITTSLFGAQNNISVSLDHRVYSVLKTAELRGIIDTDLEVRPYSTATILKHLKKIEAYTKISINELVIVKDLIKEFSETQPNNSFKSLAKYGSYYTYSENLDIGATMGARLNFSYAQSLSDFSHFDSRNGGDFFIRGDIKDIASFYMNIGIRFDHLDHTLFLKNDFYVPTKGKYDTFWNHLDEHVFYYGIYATPEISLSLLNGKLNIRWADIKRDWGVGESNLMLSGSANSFNAIELNFAITPWLRYAFLTGALGKFDAQDLYDSDNSDHADIVKFYDEYFFSDALHNNKYNNNYSAHRVEVDLPWRIKFGIFESVVYRKRFELGYLNPLSILMFEQNAMGDFDNMLAGFDLQWTMRDYFRIYGTAATTEMNEINPKRFFIAPRNVLSLQAGVDINIPFISFSTATVQYTYIAPFFYTHKPMEDDTYEISMVNEGRNIGYPLRPNSDEILVKLNLNFNNNWDGSFTFKYQRRSGQYGFNIDKWMYYTAANRGAYKDKNFSSNIFEKTVGLEATINKKLNNYPIKFSASYILTLENARVYEPTPLKVWNRKEPDATESIIYDPDNYPEHLKYNDFPVVEYKVSGPWKGWQASNALRVGVDIWF